MAEQKKPPTSSSDPLPDEEDEPAPVSGQRPSSPPADPSTLEPDAPIDDDAPVTPDEAGTPPVTREMVDDFLGTRAAQDRILEVVRARCPPRTPDDVIEDIVQDANTRALRTKWLPRSVPRMRPWLSKLTQNVTIDELRKRSVQLHRFDREVDVQELPPDPASDGDEIDVPVDPTAPPRPVLVIDDARMTTWVEKQKLSPADRLTLEMLRYKAASKESNAQVAARFGKSEAAYESRVVRFQAKWVPAWKREKARRNLMTVLLWFGFAVAIAAVLALLWRWAKRDEGDREREPARPVPSVSASASAEPVPPEPVVPPVFNQALPTEDAGPDKPPR